MMITTINILIICITILISIIIVTYFGNKNITRKYNQKEFELELEKYKFFGNIDTKKIEEELDRLVNKYFAYYALYTFDAANKQYIKEDDMNKGIKDITKNIILEMSELYSFYFRMLYNIETEEQLTAKVMEMVTNTMVSYVSEVNKPKEEKE